MEFTSSKLSDTSEENAIQQVLNGFTEGWNMHDVKMFSIVFSEDADFTNVMGVSQQGRTENEELHEPLFRTIWAKSTLVITDSKSQFIKPDVAAVDAWWKLEGLKIIDGNESPARHGLLSFVMTKESNIWLIIGMHNIDLPGSQIQ